MPYKNKEIRNKYQREYNKKNPEKKKEWNHKTYVKLGKEYNNKKAKKYRKLNRQKINNYMFLRRQIQGKQKRKYTEHQKLIQRLNSKKNREKNKLYLKVQKRIYTRYNINIPLAIIKEIRKNNRR